MEVLISYCIVRMLEGVWEASIQCGFGPVLTGNMIHNQHYYGEGAGN